MIRKKTDLLNREFEAVIGGSPGSSGSPENQETGYIIDVVGADSKLADGVDSEPTCKMDIFLYFRKHRLKRCHGYF